MTVNTLDSLLPLPVPDINILRDNGTQLTRQAAALDAIYLSALRDTLKGLAIELNHCNKQVLDILTSMPVALETTSARGLLEMLKGAVNQPVETNVDVIDQVRKELKEVTDKNRGKVSSYRTSLDNALTHISAINLKAADGFIPELEQELAPLQERLAKESAPLAGLIEKEAALNQLIDTLEEVDILDKLKPLIETLKKLIDVDPKNPVIDLIKLAMEGISNILDMAKEDIKYSHLIEERKKLQGRLDDIRGKVEELKVTVGKESAKINQLRAFQALDTPRDAYLKEARTLDEALQMYMKQIHIDERADLIEEVTRFIACCEQMTVYLDSLRRRWRDASALVTSD